MTTLALVRAQLHRPTIRVLAAVAVGAGGWYAWSPGTAFGLSGALGGWQFAHRHLLDIGLVLLAVAGALTGAGVRERHLDEHLHAAGLDRWSVLGATVGAGALTAVGVALAFVLGTAVGGLLRSFTRGGSSWVDPAAAPDVATALMVAVRMGGAAALVGVVATLIGWVARREDLGGAVVVVLAVPYLEQTSALLGRLPELIGLVAFSPWGALRAVALGDRGLPAPGYERPTDVAVFAGVVLAWLAVLVALARPPRAGHGGPLVVGVDSDADHRVLSSRRRRLAPVVAVVATVAALTVVFGATLPDQMADSLPWRWQRSWRQAVHEGWSSTQTVDRFVEEVRAGRAGSVEAGSPLTRADAISPAVTDSLRRASRIERQAEASMGGPERVTVRLRFDDPVHSGQVAFTDYLVRFSCVVDPEGRWRIDRAEGPVASATAPTGPSGGPR